MDELRALVDGYAVTADERDGERFGALFAPDGFLAVGDHRFDGRDAISKVPARLGRYDATLHLVSTHRATAGDTGDRATGVAYCEAHHRMDGSDKVQFIRYDDEYVRLDGAWYIAGRTVHVLWEEHR